VSTGIGDTLRSAREDQGRNLEEAARSLRVRTDYLRALEEERFDAFGGDIYAKGFLRNYAVELGIDPQPLLDTYRREVGQDDVQTPQLVGGMATPRQARSAPPPWVAWLLVAVVVIAGLGVLGLMQGGGRTPDVASPDAPGTPPRSSNEDANGDAAAEDDEEEAQGEDEAEEEAEEPEPEGVEVLLAFEGRSWMRVTIDGTVAEELTVEAGETLRYQGDDEVEIRFGDPGAVRGTLNGEDLGALGTRGQPITLVFTTEGAEEA
jgi:cytoskeleton protein RodZ